MPGVIEHLLIKHKVRGVSLMIISLFPVIPNTAFKHNFMSTLLIFSIEINDKDTALKYSICIGIKTVDSDEVNTFK